MPKKCFSLPLKNKIFLVVLLKVTDKTQGGETGKEGEKKPWHQCLENDSLWVENVLVGSSRQDSKQRNHAERAWKIREKYF